ncbi:helix-turn-helix domain-containing protein [Bosea sp. (in: a-proteobacteria)]|uniref:helix-turn-helix domain-containing protein n=1 Tax=Bosea sp. (in: a-proteobacteria) TaxID=1871050 RepID=UPI0027357624|nr:helix-turn-helix domain-containing protein [Bosea sp. (in: a-proteobacteria)]MDP3409683.1 helix-turn-helix domain-containing protein [Bosea sp. (in: a-proteobacteria)]
MSEDYQPEIVLEEGPSPFGRWLQSERLGKGLTVEALADKSGVSMPAIYNIEAGRTQNPIAATRNKLEQALQSSTPQAIIDEEKLSTSINQLGSLEDFDPHEINSIPAESGVYVFYDISDRPVYVGRSKDMRRRIRQHQDRFWFKRPIVERGSLIRIGDAGLIKQIEEILIRFLKSNAVLNQNLVDRDLSDD